MVGATPFLLAAVAGDATVMRILAEAGADTSVTTDLGSTVLMAAAGMGRVPGENSVGEAESEAAARLAFELGADVTAVDDIGNTALHYAAYNRLTPVLQLLADEGAPLEVRNKFGETALWLADLALQYHGGGTFQIVPTSSGALLRGLGAQATLPRPGPATLLARPEAAVGDRTRGLTGHVDAEHVRCVAVGWDRPRLARGGAPGAGAGGWCPARHAGGVSRASRPLLPGW